MEILFENKTKLSDKEYRVFLKSYQEEFSKSDIGYFIFNLFFFGMCMFFAFKENEKILGFALLIGLLVYVWAKIIRPTQSVKKDQKSQKLSGHFVNNYEFYKNYFKVQNSEGKAQIIYFKLYRVVETKAYFYIYISREYAFIVSKLGFTKGTPEEFSKFIKKKMFTKYKNRINQK